MQQKGRINLDEKTKYINQVMKTKQYNGPMFLYKYRPFDDFAFDMLENNYLYLCPANKLDDPTECITTLDFNMIYDLEGNNLKRECVKQIINMLKPYTSPENFAIIQQMMQSMMNRNGTIRPDLLLYETFKMKGLMPEGYNIAPFVNWIVGIPEKLDEPEIKPQLKKLLITAYNAREEMGICSLSANSNDEFMWENYTDNYSGYCVEYDLSDYENASLTFPVIYVLENERETNIIIQMVASFIGQMIFGFSNGEFDADRSQFIRLFLTKYKKWEYQNEWRILGDAGTKIKAPKIKAIYIGKNATKENIEKIRNFADKNNIRIIV